MSTELVKVKDVAQVPDYLQGTENEGKEQMQKEYQVPRLTIVNKYHDEEVREEHPEGTVIVTPHIVRVAAFKEPFEVVPLCFWHSWGKWRDFEDKSDFGIIEESTDESSELAQKAIHLTREPYGDQGFEYSYNQHLNLVIYIPAVNLPCVHTFAKGGFKFGNSWRHKIKSTPVAIYAQRYNLMAQTASNRKHSWNQLDWYSHQAPYVGKDKIPDMKKLHEEAVRLFVPISQRNPE